jgi:hypothetical protein
MDPSNCGMCGNACSPEGRSCQQASCVWTCGHLGPGEGLCTGNAAARGLCPGHGGVLRSCDGIHRLIIQDDNNLVLYNDRRGGSIWATATNGTSSNHLSMQADDGNLVLYDDGANPHWSSKTYGNAGAYLQVQNDGNLVVYSSSHKALWWSGTAGQ